MVGKISTRHSLLPLLLPCRAGRRPVSGAAAKAVDLPATLLQFNPLPISSGKLSISQVVTLYEKCWFIAGDGVVTLRRCCVGAALA